MNHSLNDEAVVEGQHIGQEGERIPVTGLILTNALDRLPFLAGLGHRDQATVGQLGTGLQGDVQLAIAVKRLEAQFPLEGRRDAPKGAGDKDQCASCPDPERRRAGPAMEGGGRGPPRYRTLDLAAIDHGLRSEPSDPQELAAQVFGVHLLVLPDPHQRLADEGADVVLDVERGHPCGHRLLPVGHRHDLLAFEGQEEELLALDGRLASEFNGPAIQLVLHVAQQLPFE
jgi:hypothetical protein